MEKRLPGIVINSYGAANFTLSLMLALATSYYAIFLTDVALISAIHVALIMLITHSVDGISIPFIGRIIQRTQMRWGQFRSWFLFIPVSTCVFFTLTFTNMPMSYGMKIVWLSIVYIIAHISLNFSFNAHMGFISVLSTSQQDRLWLSARNIQFGMASQFVFSILVVPMLLYFSGPNATWGYFYTVVILAGIQLFGYWNLFYQTREHEKYDPNKNLDPSSKMSYTDMITQIFGNSQLMRLMCADCMTNIGMFSLSTLAPYYFKYITGNEWWMSFHLTSMSIIAFLSAVIAPHIIKRFGKKEIYLFSTSCGVAGYFILRAFGALNPFAYTGILCAGGLFGGLAGPMRQAMYIDASEYGYYNTGKDVTAYIMSMFTMPIKIAIALATTIATYGLDRIEYVPNLEVTDRFVSDLMDIICYIPAGCGIIAVIIMSSYSLTDKNVANIMEANRIKKAGSKIQ